MAGAAADADADRFAPAVRCGRWGEQAVSTRQALSSPPAMRLPRPDGGRVACTAATARQTQTVPASGS